MASLTLRRRTAMQQYLQQLVWGTISCVLLLQSLKVPKSMWLCSTTTAAQNQPLTTVQIAFDVKLCLIVLEESLNVY